MKSQLFFAFYFVATGVLAQASGVSGLEKEFAARGLGVSREVDSDGSKRAKFLEDVTVSPAGHYERSVGEDYVNVVEQLWPHIGKGRAPNPEFKWKCQLGNGFLQTGSLAEGGFRVTYFFERAKTQRAMLTVHDVLRSGGKVIFPNYLINKDIAGRQAVVLLAATKRLNSRAVWLSTWAQTDTMFELYVETELDPDGKVRFDSRMIDSLLASLSCA